MEKIPFLIRGKRNHQEDQNKENEDLSKRAKHIEKETSIINEIRVHNPFISDPFFRFNNNLNNSNLPENDNKHDPLTFNNNQNFYHTKILNFNNYTNEIKQAENLENKIASDANPLLKNKPMNLMKKPAEDFHPYIRPKLMDNRQEEKNIFGFSQRVNEKAHADNNILMPTASQVKFENNFHFGAQFERPKINAVKYINLGFTQSSYDHNAKPKFYENIKDARVSPLIDEHQFKKVNLLHKIKENLENKNNPDDVRITIIGKKELLKNHPQKLIPQVKKQNPSSLNITNKIQHNPKTKLMNNFPLSENMMTYVFSYLEISDCFQLIRTKRKIKNCLIKNHKGFTIFITILHSIQSEPESNSLMTYFNYFINQEAVKNDYLISKKENDSIFKHVLEGVIKSRGILKSDMQKIPMRIIELLLTNQKSRYKFSDIFLSSTNYLEDTHYFSRILTENRSLIRLNVYNLTLLRNTIEILRKPLENNQLLRTIKIEFSSRSFLERESYTQSCEILMETINKNGRLNELTFKNLEIQKASSKFFSDFIETNKSVKTFTLNSPKIIKVQTVFGDALRYNTTLEHLKFKGVNLNKTISGSISNDLSNEAVYIRRYRLPVNTHIKQLSFNKCVIKDLIFIKNILLTNPNITHLKLKRSKINERIVGPICEALKINNTLISLDLSSNILRNSGFVCILSSLYHNKTLRILNLENNFIDSPRLDFLASFFSGNSKLSKLELADNNIDVATKKFIEDILRSR